MMDVRIEGMDDLLHRTALHRRAVARALEIALLVALGRELLGGIHLTGCGETLLAVVHNLAAKGLRAS